MTIVGRWFREGEWQDMQHSISEVEDVIALSMCTPHDLTTLYLTATDASAVHECMHVRSAH